MSSYLSMPRPSREPSGIHRYCWLRSFIDSRFSLHFFLSVSTFVSAYTSCPGYGWVIWQTIHKAILKTFIIQYVLYVTGFTSGEQDGENIL